MGNWYAKGQSQYTSGNFHMAYYIDMDGYPEANYDSQDIEGEGETDDPFMAFGIDTETWVYGQGQIEIGLIGSHRIRINSSGVRIWTAGDVWEDPLAAGEVGISEATLFAYLGIGISNKRWKNCVYDQGVNVTLVAGVYRNSGASNMQLYFDVPLEPIKNGKNLTITRIKIGLYDADGDDFITILRLYGAKYDALPVQLVSDGTDYNTAPQEVILDHADQTIGGVYNRAIVGIFCSNTNANDLDIHDVSVEYYYA